MRRLASLMLLVCLFLLLASPAQAERRVALVIGNGAYKDAPLRNPVNDARDMAAALKSLGFEVILKVNANLGQMEQAVDQFWSTLKGGGTGLFFFAGHGVQVRGANYLIPVDANIQVEQDVKVRSLDVNLVLGRMENAGNPLNIVILDACRNNPFTRAWRNAGQGLAKMDAPAGTIVAYATAPDSVAADGEGKNGLYTNHLLRTLRTPGQTIEQVFKQVRVGVMNDTARRQIPWETSSLTGEFYFKPGAGGAPVAPPVEVALAPVPKQPPLAPLTAPKGSPGQTWRDPVTGMEFVWVPGGTYEMGCGSWTSECIYWEKPVHTVGLNGFWLGKFEVTQGQWKKVMGGNPSRKKGDNYPVEKVSWEDAKAFISRLNAQSSAKFRLPTEAEWEYAARSGGRPEKYAGGDDLNRLAWYRGNSGGSMHEVGTKDSNNLGLYDMSGNVSEWCEDVYSGYTSHSQDNPIYAGDGSSRVFRGGSWFSEPRDVRSTDRSYLDRGIGVGFRLVRIP